MCKAGDSGSLEDMSILSSFYMFIIKEFSSILAFASSHWLLSFSSWISSHLQILTAYAESFGSGLANVWVPVLATNGFFIYSTIDGSVILKIINISSLLSIKSQV